MKYRRLDENYDMCFGHDRYDFIKDSEAVAQAVRTKILLFRREWWEDVKEGTPLFTDIIGSQMVAGKKEAIDLILRDRIFEVPHVETIKNFKSEFNSKTRTYSLYCAIETSFGDTIVNMDLDAVNA